VTSADERLVTTRAGDECRELAETLARHGIAPELEVLPADPTWSETDPVVSALVPDEVLTAIIRALEGPRHA
jgi:hypothetical protein